GDTALLAIEGGHRIGAGWFRLFREAAPGYGFVDDATPELTIVVVPSRQGQGIGQLLLAGLIERAQADAYRGLSVSVEKSHPEIAAYEAPGFEPVAENGLAATTAGEVAAFTADGALRWRIDVGQLAQSCQQLDGYGIVGTGAIDSGSQTLYVADAFDRLHALDLASGVERDGWPVRVFADFR